ncbi:hypothetical protein HPB49_007625 [Dermacentor silvarum]|uniref:Uncharacterized protein n=1 Tax=Dermacentor silvarum TaxID=543639 RepID=A0ACB8DBH2_DERSI|nr:hypothetical protein HPB49_007625 [Dermacentor silvarum]
MYYFIPRSGMLAVLRATIEEKGIVPFQNSAVVPLDTFLELLSSYFHATVICVGEQHYIQSGVCNGSRVAPYLCDLLLAAVGRRIEDALKDNHVLAIFRYVDDFLVLCKTADEPDLTKCREGVLTTFHEACPDLNFTFEMPEKKYRFLDLAITFETQHTCCNYEARSCNGFLPYDSDHSKNLKRAIVTTVLQAALKKSCHHLMEESFMHQVTRLNNADYPKGLLTVVAEGMLKKMKLLNSKLQEEENSQQKRKKVAAVPYVHGLSRV